MRRLTLLLVLALAQSVLGQTLLIDGDRAYLIDGDKATRVQVDRIIRVGGTTTTPTDPKPDPTDPLARKVKDATDAVLKSNPDEALTAKALASVYSLVSDSVKDGGVAPGKATAAVKAATDAVLRRQKSGKAWDGWRDNLKGEVIAATQDGVFNDKAKASAFLAKIAAGIESAQVLQTSGFLDSIDIDKLIRLIELIVKIFSAFG